MATDSWVTIGGFIASTGSAIAAFFAVKQSVMQRTISIKPQLIIKDIELHMVYIGNSFFSCEPYHKEYMSEFKIPIINIGIGTALNIEYKWKFKFEKFISLCNFETLQQHPIFDRGAKVEVKRGVFFYVNSKIEYQNFDLLCDGNLRPFSIPKINKELEYILPITQDKKETTISLPTIIPLLIIEQADKSTGLTRLMMESIEGGVLNITYEDISGKKRNIEFIFNLRMIKFQSMGELGPESIFKLSFNRSAKRAKIIKALQNISIWKKD
jgi:hypothetical protein